MSGALREIRTPDPLVRSQVLYPAELWAHQVCALYGFFWLCIVIFQTIDQNAYFARNLDVIVLRFIHALLQKFSDLH